MTFRRWLDGWKFSARDRRSRRGQSQRRKAAGAKLSVLTLEDRTVPAFFGPVDYAAGAYPFAAVAADFNNDSVLDLAVLNYYDSSVSVLLGNASVPGTFDPAVTSPTGGSYPLSLAVGDFDGDPFLDIATVNSGDVSILLGNGDGSFEPPQSLGLPAVTVPGSPDALAQYPVSIAVGDITGDHMLDLTVGGQSSFTTRNGPYTRYDYYGNPYNYYTYESHPNGHLNVLVGNGSGDFTPPAAEDVKLLEGSYPTSVVLADFDAVAGLDLAVADSYLQQVHVLSGNNDGTFDAPTNYSTGWSPSVVLTGDFNGDGISDLATAEYYGMSVFLGNGAAGVGDGTFQSARRTSVNFYPLSLAVGDFDADGSIDLASTSNDYSYYYGYQGHVNVLLGHGDGTFGLPRTTVVAGSTQIRALATGDFDGDDFPDVAVTDLSTYHVSVLLNDQYWPPTPPPTVSINDVGVTEGNTGSVNATFTVYLSYAHDDDITVHYETANGSADGSDYTATSGDVTIPHGETSRTITVAVTGDRVGESTETFAVNLSAPVHASIGDAQGIGYIYDDEPTISINDPTVTEGNTGSVNATFTVRLSFASDVDVTVHYATASGTATGSDFTSTSGDVTIPHGQTSATFTVAVTGDRVAEDTETFVVNLSSPHNAGIADSQGVGTILDNEPRISINSVTKKEGNGGTIQFIFTVTLSVAYDQAVTVNYATADGTARAGSDYTAKNGTLTLAAGVRTMTITIVVLPDKLKETDETFFVNLSGASSNAFLPPGTQGIGIIQDDDIPPGKKK